AESQLLKILAWPSCMGALRSLTNRWVVPELQNRARPVDRSRQRLRLKFEPQRRTVRGKRDVVDRPCTRRFDQHSRPAVLDMDKPHAPIGPAKNEPIGIVVERPHRPARSRTATSGVSK